MTRTSSLLLAAALSLLLPGRARGGDAPPAETPAPARKPPASAAPAQEPRPASWSSGERPRVTAGVLVRAASKQAQQREANGGGAADRPRAPAQGAIESLEIDWNGPSATP